MGGGHKKVKSEIPALKNLISVSCCQNQADIDKVSNISSYGVSQKSKEPILTAPTLPQPNPAATKKFFIRNRLEAATQDDQKQYNVSIEQLDLDIEDSEAEETIQSKQVGNTVTLPDSRLQR